MKKLTLEQLNVAHKKVLLRVDFNVPLTKSCDIVDDTRIQCALPSIQSILNRQGIPVIMSHLGRPKGQKTPPLSLTPCAKRLATLLKRKVTMAPDCIGKEVQHVVDQIQTGEVVVLENLRFHPGEQHPDRDPTFTSSLAQLGDAYVNDAFGTAHRNHASIVPITHFFKKESAMGLLMEKEVEMLSKLTSHPKRPFSIVLGGAKLSTKIGLLEALLPNIDALFIGGGMAFTFFKAQGIAIGDSISDEALLPKAEAMIKTCKERGIPLHLPSDIIISEGDPASPSTKSVKTQDGIPLGWKGMDIGLQTIRDWEDSLLASATLFWNGPMGVCEFPHFAHGTAALAQVLSQISGMTMIGGGDSIAAIKQLKLEKNFTHLSTGGGASLAYLEHGHLPGINALSDNF